MGGIFPIVVLSLAWLLVGPGSGAFAQQSAQKSTPTAPDNETRTPAPVRSIHSMGKDWAVPMCPSHFHDGLRTNGIAGPHDTQVMPPTVKKRVPATITQQAIADSGKTHIGNYIVIVNVVVNTQGVPTDLCLQKSSGFGLDAATASAVSQYVFNPAKQNGKPVRMRVPVEVRFENPIIAMGGNALPGPPAE